MAKLTSSVLAKSVTSEWLAKTYSEYLMSCAEDQLDFNNAITEACDDDDLSTALDEYRDIWDNNIDVINNAMSSFALLHGATVQDIQERNDAFHAAMATWEPSVEVTTNAWAIADKYSATYQNADDFLSAYIDGNLTSETGLSNQPSVYLTANTLAQGVLNARKLPNGYKYPLGEGYVDAKDLIRNLIFQANINTDLAAFSQATYDSQGNFLTTAELIYEDVVDQLRDAAASNIAWAQGFLAAAMSNVSDRISTFTSKISSMYNEAYTSTSTAFNNVKAFLSDAQCDVRSFYQQATDFLGFELMAQHDSKVSETDVWAYTGSSPYAGVDLHVAKNVVALAGSTLAATVYAAWRLISPIATRVYDKFKPAIMSITNNPVDYKVIDKDASSYEFDKFQYQASEIWPTIEVDNDKADALIQELNKFVGKCVSFESCFGSISIIVNRIDSGVETSDTMWITVVCSYMMKPKAVNPDALVSAGILGNNQAGTTYTFGSAIDFLNPSNTVLAVCNALDTLMASDNLYIESESDEVLMLNGLKCSILAMTALFTAQLQELIPQIPTSDTGWTGQFKVFSQLETWFNVSAPTDYSIALGVIGAFTKASGTVTNKDFLIATSGYDNGRSYSDSDLAPVVATDRFTMWDSSVPSAPGMFCSAEFLPMLMVEFFMVQQADKIANPSDYLFLPYSTDNWTFPPARFAIKTDAENTQIAEIFASVMIIAVVVTITVLVGRKVVRNIKRAKYLKHTARKGRIDNKMWNNKTLSKKELRQYLRSDRKLSKMNMWSKGSAAKNLIDNTAGPVSNIMSQITTAGTGSMVNSSDAIQSFIDAAYHAIVG